MRRIFIAISIPGKIRDKLTEYKKEFPDLPVRWTKRENLHFTLLFIGNASDQETVKICEAVKKTASRHSSFQMSIGNIDYGPPGKLPPRMIWAEGSAEKELFDLQKDLEKEIQDLGMHASSEKKGLKLHVTLGRVKAWQWAKMEEEERPEIKKEISFVFEVSSIEVMESKLRPKGPDYTVLESAPLKK